MIKYKYPQYTVSTGMDMYQAASLIPWYDILTDDFIIYMGRDYFKDIIFSENDNLAEYLFDLFQYRMWIKGQDSGEIRNNDKRLTWDSIDGKMSYISISKVINYADLILLEIK